jgi:hypothetical protein
MEQKIIENRNFFLSELTSGKYKKGTIISDEKGKPVIKSKADEGYCACALMHDLFFYHEGTNNSRNYLKALALTPEKCRFIQHKLNDTELSFAEIAEEIKEKVFKFK